MSTKLSVLFVDDDENLLQGFQDNLREERKDWDVTFISEPKAAVEVLKLRGFDVVVSDMYPADTETPMLMKIVEKLYPETLRIVLSGHSAEDSVTNAMGVSQQYFAKPCSAEEIMGMLERLYGLHLELRENKLRQLVSGLRNLPTPPDLYLRLTAEIQNENTTLRSIADMIAEDVSMTAEILRITNSGYFALGSPVLDVYQALRLLGVETVRALVFAAGVFRKFDLPADLANALGELDAHCLFVATQSRRVAEKLQLSDARKDQAFCAGMLSCIGVLVLMDAYPDKVRSVFSRVVLGEDYGLVEREVFGASQAEIGAYLLGLWGFSDVMVEAILYHDRPSDCVCKDHSALTCVHLARAVGAELSVNGVTLHPVHLDEAYVNTLGLHEVIHGIALGGRFGL